MPLLHLENARVHFFNIMNKYFYATILSLVFVFLIGGSSAANAQTVNVTGSVGAVKRGGSVKGSVVLNIPGGLHVNSNRPNSEYAIPTTVRLTATGGKVGGAIYPRGKNRKFSFSDETINVYEGRTTISFNLNVPASYRGKTVNVRAVVRYQACTDEVCYAPKSQTLNLTAQVR